MSDSPARAPEGAPNVVVVLFDDLGFAQFGCYGSDIATPNIDRLAQGGLRYNRFHVTALCSPTRASLLTGRNHHAVGFGSLADVAVDLPGYNGRIPDSAATLPRILRDHGYSTMAVGKWHLAPGGERTAAGPFDRWPLGLGFERYYGFLRGDANHWAPELIRDNSYVDPPATPEEGYHLTEDMADEAIRMVVNQQESAPGKPFFLYFAPGALHAPHHVERSWADAYAGRFDHGWERWREEVFARQVEDGVIPADTTLSERPSWVPDWEELTDGERRLYARMQEVAAGMVTHTDAQIGRLVDALERLGVLDDTIIMVTSDNGAAASGGVTGTINEHRFSNRVGDDLSENLEHLDDWGGIHGYPLYSWGWAWAGNTPFRLWKRYTWLGGTRVPLVVHWPAGIRTTGEVREQLTYVTDLAPTVLAAAGITPPEVVAGVPQQRIDGTSMLGTFADAAAPDTLTTQYFEMVGSRSIISDGWKATTDHVSRGIVDEERLLVGSRDFDTDTWSLFRLEDDYAESRDLAAEHPEVLGRLQALWQEEAERNKVFPMADSLMARLDHIRGPLYPVGQRAVLVPEGGPVSDEALPRFGQGAWILADVDVPAEGAEGVLFALGDWTGGFAAYVADGSLTVSVAAPGGLVRARSDSPLPTGRHRLGMALRPLPGGGFTLDAVVDEQVVGTTRSSHGLPHGFQHGGASLRMGFDRGLPVDDGYRPPFPWTGTVHHVLVQAGEQVPPGLDELRVAFLVE